MVFSAQVSTSGEMESFGVARIRGLMLQLLPLGPQVEIERNGCSTALENAAYTGNLELAKVLIAANANVNHRNLWGWSPLHLAVQHARFEIARLLIAHGADVNMANNLGKTPISLAPNDAAMKQLLIEAGAK
jgi:ankyrin repeat protein